MPDTYFSVLFYMSQIKTLLIKFIPFCAYIRKSIEIYDSCVYAIGKIGDAEIDFAAQPQNEKLYVPVTQEIPSEKTENREYSRLLEVSDNYPKYVLRTDVFADGNYEEIKTMHMADFLLRDAY